MLGLQYYIVNTYSNVVNKKFTRTKGRYYIHFGENEDIFNNTMVNKVEDILASLGDPGSYAKVIFFFVSLNYIPVAFNHLAMAVFGARTTFTCKVPEGFPANLTISPTGEPCKIFANYSSSSNATESCSTGYDYIRHRKYMDWQLEETNIVMKWDLVCSEKYRVSLATSIYFAGVMLGGLAFGTISDRIGRKATGLICLYVPVLLGVMVFFVDNYILFVILRFFIGFFMQGLQTASFVHFTEFFRKGTHRAYVCATMEVVWSIGVMLLAGITFLIRDWRYIELAICLPPLIALPYTFFVPESLRWLIASKRYKEADKVLRKAAEFNNITLSEDPLDLKNYNAKTEDPAEGEKHYNVLDMFKTPKLRLRTFVSFYVWMATSLIYYGLSLNASGFAGNKYLNFFVSGAVELPAYALGIFILSRFGRRIPLCIYLLIGGVALIIAGTIPKTTTSGGVITDIRWVGTMLAWIGKFSAAGCWSVLFLYGSELYPTVIRNVAVGACAFWARVGSLIAPQILLLGDYYFTELPLIVYGSVAILGGFLTLLLPETLHSKLPDTIEEAEGITMNDKDKHALDNSAYKPDDDNTKF
ncbi:unnamed protein product [Owenia fusiformis]|uniref:Uncharacterized protein n=1 Tax=Owenia fusiformis TaxID=6347 RepID=A0A8J1U926_OWEFU|nr:unnamed protein product [Owenia fusiformis]